MRGVFTEIEEGKILVSLTKAFYEKDAVFAAAHKLTDRFAILIEPIDEKTVGVYFQSKTKDGTNKEELYQAAQEFCNEVLDQQVRIDIEASYGPIRDMIVKQAFSPISLSELSNSIKNTK